MYDKLFAPCQLLQEGDTKQLLPTLLSLESTTTVQHKAQEASKVLQQKHSCGTKLLLENCKLEKRQMNYARHLRLQRAKLGQHQRLQISCTKDPFSGGLYICKRGSTYQKANSDCTLPLRALEAFTKYVKNHNFFTIRSRHGCQCTASISQQNLLVSFTRSTRQ